MIDTKEPKTADPLAELERLRAKVRKFAAEESEYATKGFANAKEIQRLEDEARKLGHREPELVDEFDRAVSKSNPVGKLQAAAEKIEAPDALYAKRDHAARIRAKTEADLAAFVLDQFDAIQRARIAEARRLRDAVRDLREDHRRAAEAFLAFAQESIGLTGPHPDLNGQHVGGIDEVSDLLRVLDRLEDLPLPTVFGYDEPEVGE